MVVLREGNMHEENSVVKGFWKEPGGRAWFTEMKGAAYEEMALYYL
jgi:redox-sensitive bicupin YhaK (pirin superfamily)